MDNNLPFPSHLINTLQRRGVNPQVLMQQSPMQTQVTPGAPGFDPSLQTPTATPMPDHPAAMGAMPPQQAPNPFVQSMQPQQPEPQQTEAEAIVGALSDRLAHHSKQAQKFLSSILQSAQPQQPTA